MHEQNEPISSTEAAAETLKRSRIARQIVENRRIDRESIMVTDRNEDEYNDHLLGVQALLEYATTFPSAVVYDVGSGTTKAISEIAQSEVGQRLRFVGTGLRRSPEVAKYLGNEHFVVTAAETLRGIPDASGSVIIGINSVAYSTAPDMVVGSIDRVLQPGGVFKGTFQLSKAPSGSPIRPFREFYPAFQSRGYSLAMERHPRLNLDVCIAVKPGKNLFADELLEEDHEQWKLEEPRRVLRIKEQADQAVQLVEQSIGLESSREQIAEFLQTKLKVTSFKNESIRLAIYLIAKKLGKI